ncbi:hypothetical protein CFP56_040853 [Quercus suber]|uniref:Uncharacterized protein n=1 Tax=Quercus suber TaxID=58331 RepID=A0AAW0IX53_QUESU
MSASNEEPETISLYDMVDDESEINEDQNDVDLSLNNSNRPFAYNRHLQPCLNMYLGAWAPAQNDVAAAPTAGRSSIGQSRGGVGAGTFFSRQDPCQFTKYKEVHITAQNSTSLSSPIHQYGIWIAPRTSSNALYLGAWAPAQNDVAAAPTAGRSSIGQSRGGVGAGTFFSSRCPAPTHSQILDIIPNLGAVDWWWSGVDLSLASAIHLLCCVCACCTAAAQPLPTPRSHLES